MASLEKLREMQIAAINPLVRKMKIELLEPSQAISKTGFTIDYLEWKYLVTEYENQEWRHRRCPMFKDEAKLLLDNAPYEADFEYEVIAEKGMDGFWVWRSIQKVEAELEGAA